MFPLRRCFVNGTLFIVASISSPNRFLSSHGVADQMLCRQHSDLPLLTARIMELFKDGAGER